jgi:hypothetical protein
LERLEASSSTLAMRSASPRQTGRISFAAPTRPLDSRTTVPQHDTTRPALCSAQLAVPSTARRSASQGSAWGACAPSATQCTNFVSESGTVDVLALVNGDTLRASVPVNVVPCPTSDALLDTKTMRDGLAFLMDKSHVVDPTQRRGNAAWIFRDTLTGEVTFTWYASASAACSVIPVYVTPPPNSILLAGSHAHPFAKGEALPPGMYPKAPRGGMGAWGPSPQDDTTAYNSSVPQYVVDKDNIRRLAVTCVLLGSAFLVQAPRSPVHRHTARIVATGPCRQADALTVKHLHYLRIFSIGTTSADSAWRTGTRVPRSGRHAQ